MILPKQKTKPSIDPMQYSILLYGPTKVGKSTFASQAKGVFFIATEPGLNALSVYKVDVDNWETLLQVCAALSDDEHDYQTVVLDTVDNAYDLCLEYVCKSLKGKDGRPISHPSDLPYGKGWGAVNAEFKRVLTKLAMMPLGLILISHSKVQEIETRTGKYDKIVPTTGGSKIVLGLMDMVLMTDIESVKTENGVEHRRLIHTKPTSTYDAGDRTGKLPETIPLDYRAFVDAFNQANK